MTAAARALGVSRRTLYNWRRAGRVRWHRRGDLHSHVTISHVELARLAKWRLWRETRRQER